MLKRWGVTLALCLAELFILAVWFSASAVLPQLAAAYGLGPNERSALAMAVQTGFVAGTLFSALFNLPDVLPPKWLMFVGALLGASSNAAVALFVPRFPLVLALRLVTGVAMAFAYPPAMKILATWFQRGRGLAIGLLIAALTLGSASPHLLWGLSPGGMSWTGLLLAASGLALVGALVVALLVREGPQPFPRAQLDLRMALVVFRERGLRLMCFGYFGHMWELYAMWAWLTAFLQASLAADAGRATSYLGLNASLAAFATMGLGGSLGAWLGGVCAERWGRTALCMAAMGASGLCSLLIGLSFGGPPGLTLLLALLWGVTVIADSAQFSAGVTELAEPAYVGTALTAQTAIGFLITLVSIWLVPRLVAVVGWRFAFAALAAGPLSGVAALGILRGLPESKRLAAGRR